MTKTSGFATPALAAILLTALVPAISCAGHYTLAFERQLPAWENGAGMGCLGSHFCRVWVWDENGNPMSGIHLETERNVDIGDPQTDPDGWAEITVNKGADFDLFCTDGTESTSDTTRLMTSDRPACWGHYSFEVGFLYKTDASNPGEFDLDLHGTWNEPLPPIQEDDVPYTKSLAYNGVNPADYWSDQTDLGNWQTASSYFGQTFVATGNRVVAARAHGALPAGAPVDWEARIVNFPDLSPVGPPYKGVTRASAGGGEVIWAANDNPVVPGQTYMFQVRRGGEGMSIWRVNANVYPNGQYYEGATAYPGLDLNGHVVCMNYGGGTPASISGLDAYFKLDEASGTTAKDSSGNGRHGTLLGSPLWQPAGGKLAGALQFDGDNDSIEVPDYKGITGSKPRTLAAWIKTDTDTFKDIVGWGSEASGERWSLVTGVTGGSFGIYVVDGFAFGATNVCDGEWRHIAAVLDSDANPDVSEVRLYLDGRAETPGNVYSRQINTAQADNVKIATFNDRANRHFQGLIDDVAIFDVALTDKQIARLCRVGGESFLAPCGRIGIDEDAVLLGDINRNCKVEATDFAFLANVWLDTGPALLGDILEDESVDHLDVSALTGNWTESIAPLTLDLGLAAHFKLDESSGTTAEDSIASNNGTLYNSPIWRPTAGMADGAIEMDGTDDYISTNFALDPADGPFAAAAWMKSGAPAQVIISQTNGDGIGVEWLSAESATGTLITNIRVAGRGSQPLTSDFVITDGAWHRIVVVWDGSRRSLYADGAEVARDIEAQAKPMSANGGLYFGAANTLAPASFFQGLIDDIRIYNRALTPEEASALAR